MASELQILLSRRRRLIEGGASLSEVDSTESSVQLAAQPRASTSQRFASGGKTASASSGSPSSAGAKGRLSTPPLARGSVLADRSGGERKPLWTPQRALPRASSSTASTPVTPALASDATPCGNSVTDLLRAENEELKAKNAVLLRNEREVDVVRQEALNENVNMERLTVQLEAVRSRQKEGLERLGAQLTVLQQQNEVLSRDVRNVEPSLVAQEENMALQKENRRLRAELQKYASECKVTEADSIQKDDVRKESSILDWRGESVDLRRSSPPRQWEPDPETTQDCQTFRLEIADLQALVRKQQAANAQLKDENRSLEEELEQSRRGFSDELARVRDVHQKETEALREEHLQLQEAFRKFKEDCTSSSSEGRLKAAMLCPASSAAELAEAIGSVDAVLAQARREHANKELREKRSAFEALHSALEKKNEDRLAEAIASARRANVDAEDIEKAEAQLEQLRAITPEQRAMNERNELISRQKKEAFLLVKRDDAVTLAGLLDSLGDEVQWKDWKDYSGSTLWRLAQRLRSEEVQKCLAPLLGAQIAAQQHRQPSLSRDAAPSPVIAELAEVRSGAGQIDGNSGTIDETTSAAVGAEGKQPETSSNTSVEISVARPSEADEADFRRRAFRAVVQEDVVALGEVIERVPNDVWSVWENKAGKDLVTLSEERGSTAAYSILAKALGFLHEMKRDTFEEREAVWIYFVGSVQPLRATVLEDTPEEADDVLIEYWDGDDPPVRVERCLVHKSA